MSVPVRRSLLLVPLVLLSVLALPRPAHAGILVSSVGSCDDQTLSRPFLPWLDLSSYYLAGDGSFVQGGRGWELAGGAHAVATGEPYDVAGDGSQGALSLGSAGSATSPSTCVGILHPTARFFVRNTGNLLGHLRVDVRFEDATGAVRQLTIAQLLGGARWSPTLPLPIVASLLPLLPGERTPIQLRFTAVGGSWDVDDVYVDPYRKG
jgi:hypothetical protein